MNPPIALQLYSVREALAADFTGTVRRVAEMGYPAVEVFGNFVTAKETRQLADDLGLKVCGRHSAFDPLRADFQSEVDFALEVGAPYLVCAYAGASEAWTWPRIAEALGRMAEDAERQGLKFAYHNHAHELSERHEGRPVMDLLLDQPRLYGELDIAWLYAGGADPAEYLGRYAGRAPLVHVKDVAKNPTGKGNAGAWDTVELGRGEVDLPAALKAAQAEWLIVEQDNSPDPVGSAERNLETLRRLL